MTASKTTVRRGLYGIFAGGLIGAAASAAITLPAANAAPDVCSASGVANTQSSVSQSVGNYLTSHPETDKALTEIAKQPATQAQASYATFFKENPKVADELRILQQPVSNLQQQCDMPVTPTDGISTALQAT